MERLISQIQNNQIITIVGLAKNTGKTTTINHIMNKLKSKHLTFGITSTGRDGEEFDVLTNTIAKPAIYIPAGVYFATTNQLVEGKFHQIEIVKETEFRTSIGKVVICQARTACKVQIAGPTTNRGIKEVCDVMISFGCKCILVDGSINRLSVTSSQVTNAVILTTGASVHEDMNEVINITKGVVNRYGLEEIGKVVKHCIVNKTKAKNRFVAIYDDQSVELLNAKRRPVDGDFVTEFTDKDIEYIYIPGAVFEEDIRYLLKQGYCGNTTFIVEDGSKIFFNIQQYQEMGLKFKTFNKTNILLITINPEYPTYYSFDKHQFLKKTKETFAHIPIYNLGRINV